MLNEIMNKAKEHGIKNIYVFAHTDPDGDAKGASLALVEYFRGLGYNSKYIISKESRKLENIFGSINTTKYIGNESFIAVICDSSTKIRCENMLWEKAVATYKIDHHRNSEEFADYNYCVSEASSTCELIWRLMDKERITPKIATYLYTGIYTDTGMFEFSITENLFFACADLIKRGANNILVSQEVRRIGYYRAKMRGYILLNYLSYSDGVIGIVINFEECSKYQFNPLSVAQAVNVLKDIAGARIFFVACEEKSGKYFVELRSAQNTDIDVSKIAINNGGGGLFHASGFTAKNLKQVNKVIELLKKL